VKKFRVIVLMHDYMVPPEDVSGLDLMTVPWKTEHDVIVTLREMGHEVHTIGVGDDLAVVRRAVQEWKPDIVFNMMEAFHELGTFDHNVVSYLELLRVPYTGSNPRGLMLARDKALSKTILHYHRIPVPEFAVVHMGRKVRMQKRLGFPLIVKSLTQEGSTGISQASVVEDEGKLLERVRFIHESIGTDAILERYIEGRELYVGILGNAKLTVFPGSASDRHGTREVEHEVSAQVRHQDPRSEAAGRCDGAHSVLVQTRLSLTRPERLRTHRPAHGRGRQGLRHRGQPQSATGLRRRLRGIRRTRRGLLRTAAAADHRDRTSVEA
jgi:hypothetical protein